MRKLIGIELVKMRHYPVVWLVAMISVGQGILYAIVDRYASAIARYPKVEYVIFIFSSARWFCMVSLFLTAYVIAGDYSMRTVLNVLSAGIDKKKYFFSRLASQMLFIFGLYACGFTTFIVSRIIHTGRVNSALSPLQLLTLFLVMAMQPMAYVALANMISICCKRQVFAVVISEGWLFLAIIFRIYSIGEEFYTGTGRLVAKGPMAYEPMWVLECADQFAVGNIFSFGFLQYAISATVIMAVTSAIGYACLMRLDVH